MKTHDRETHGMSDRFVVFEDCTHYGCITLKAPDQRNAMNRAALLELQNVLKQCMGRFACVIITGSGPWFCTGADDEQEEESAPSAGFSRQGDWWVETIEMMRKHPAVFVAAVNGEASGNGVALINACELAIAAEDAKIGMPEISTASYPALAGPSTQLRILRKHASWMILTGRSIDGRTAARWGLVNIAVPAERLMEEVRSIARDISKFNPVTVDWTKKALDDIPSHVSDWTAALEYGRLITSVGQNKVGKDKVTPSKF